MYKNKQALKQFQSKAEVVTNIQEKENQQVKVILQLKKDQGTF